MDRYYLDGELNFQRSRSQPDPRQDQGYHQTSEDWNKSRRPTGFDPNYRWVDPRRENRRKEDWPYSYTDHFLCGSPVKGCDAVYSDRLHQWDADAYSRAVEAVRNAQTIFGHWGIDGGSKFLTAYYGRPIECLAIAEGCNQSNGFPYHIFWFTDAKKK